MEVERAEYYTEEGYWAVWGIVQAPGVTVVGVHTVNAPSDFTIEQLAAIIDAMYLS